MYLARQLQEHAVPVSRIAYGLPSAATWSTPTRSPGRAASTVGPLKRAVGYPSSYLCDLRRQLWRSG